MKFLTDGRGRVAAVPANATVQSAGRSTPRYFATDPAGGRREISETEADMYFGTAGWVVTRETPAGDEWTETDGDEWVAVNTPTVQSGDG